MKKVQPLVIILILLGGCSAHSHIADHPVTAILQSPSSTPLSPSRRCLGNMSNMLTGNEELRNRNLCRFVVHLSLIHHTLLR